MKPFTFWLAQRLVKTPYVSLPNLLAGREIVTELLQHDCVPDKLAAAVMPLLEDGPQTDELKQTFLTLHKASVAVPMNRPLRLCWSWQKHD
jgi:lipid-A-disaccharide synthase